MDFKKEYCANYLYDGDKNCKKQCQMCLKTSNKNKSNTVQVVTSLDLLK